MLVRVFENSFCSPSQQAPFRFLDYQQTQNIAPLQARAQLLPASAARSGREHPAELTVVQQRDVKTVFLPRVGDDARDLPLGKSPVGAAKGFAAIPRSEEHTSELQSQFHLVCRLLLEKK